MNLSRGFRGGLAIAGEKELFEDLQKDPALKKLKEAFGLSLPGTVWWLLPKLSLNAKQWRQASDASSHLWQDKRSRGSEQRLRRAAPILARKARESGGLAWHALTAGETVLCFPLSLGDNAAGYLVITELRGGESRVSLAPLAFALRSALENFWKTGELSRLSATIRPRAIALSTVHTVHRIINSTLNLDELVSRLAHLTAQVLRVNRCSIYLLDKSNNKKGRLVCKALVGYPKKGRRERSVPTGSQMEGRVARSADIQMRKSVLCVPLIDEDVIGVVTVLGKKDKKDFNQFDLEILTTLAEEAVIAIKNAQLYEEQRRVTLSTIQSLASILGSRSPHQSVMSPEMFAHMALSTAEVLGLADDQKQALHYAALLKETTRIGIPEEILRKPSKLTGEELSALRDHTAHGAKIVQKFESLKTVAPIILYSREKFDGTGYPEGLKGEKIPIGARILSVMNAFEAIIVGRPYRGQLTQTEALAELQRNSGSQFDPRVVEAFVRVVKKESLYKNLRRAPGA